VIIICNRIPKYIVVAIVAVVDVMIRHTDLRDVRAGKITLSL
jgi:hypothetical protein